MKAGFGPAFYSIRPAGAESALRGPDWGWPALARLTVKSYLRRTPDTRACFLGRITMTAADLSLCYLSATDALVAFKLAAPVGK